MKNSKRINSLALIGILFSSILAVVLTHNSSEAIVDRAVRKDAAHEVVSADPMTYAQVGTAENGSARLRFATPVKGVDKDSVVTYTRNVNGYDEKQITVQTVYKSVAGEGSIAYYYSEAEGLVTEDPQDGYYWANYVAAFSENSEAKDEMFSVVLDVDGTKAPFLSASYNSVLAEGPVASFVDASGTLLGRSIVESGNVPVYVGEVPVVIDADFIGWSDGETVYETLPAITTDTVFKAEYGYPLTLDNPYASVAMEAKYVTGEASFVTTHDVKVMQNGEEYTGEVTYTSSAPDVLTVDGDKVSALKAGQATVTVSAEGKELGSFTVNVTEYTPVRTTADFLAMGNDQTSLSGKYLLMNDIDFDGADISTFTSYSSRNTRTWSGVFDGNGHTLSDFNVVSSSYSGNDLSIFGYAVAGSAIRNTNFVGVKTSLRSAVVASMVFGVVENIYVEFTYTSDVNTAVNNNNPASGVVGKVESTGVVRNCISVANATHPTVVETNFGGVASKVNRAGATIENCMTISSLNIKAIWDTSLSPSTVKNVGKYADLNDFYANAVTSSFDTDVWTFAEGKYPHVGQMKNMMSATNLEHDVYANASTVVEANSSLPVYYKLANQIANVTVNETTGEVVVGDVVAGTDIEVIAYNLYTNETITFTVTVKEATVEVDETNYTPVSFDVITGVSENSDYVKAHNLVLKQDGEVYVGEDVEYVSSNPSIATADATNVTAIGDGIATITIKVGGAELYSFDVTVVAWTPVRTIAEFEAIENNLSGKYKLLNNLDYNGGNIKTIAHYAKGHDAADEGFQGIFDGNGYSIMNYAGCVQMNGTSAANCSPFGHIGLNGVVKNLNVVNGTIATRIAGGIATVNLGTIENCYVDVYVTYNKNHENNNPIGGIVSKNYNTVRNCVAVVTLADGIYAGSIGTIAGRNWDGDDYITNCYGLSTVGITESGIPANGYTANSAGTNITNSTVYSTLAELNAAINNDATFNKSLWTVVEGKYPHVGQMANIMSVVDTEMEAYANATTTVKVNGGVKVYYKLAQAYENVSINETTGAVTIGEVLGGSNIEVVAYNLYTDETITVTLTVAEASYEANNPNTTLSINDKLVGDKVAHNVVVTKDGQPYTGSEITFTSDNENVVVADATNITIKGEGTAVVTVAANGISLTTITVNATYIWIPVNSTSEFLAMGTNGTTMSKKYKLMTNLDFNGATIVAFSSYKTNEANKLTWTGMFDGQGYTVSNFLVDYNKTDSKDRDRSIFGYMSAGSVVKNVNFIGAKGPDRPSIVSSWCEGTIENVYAEFTYSGKGGNDSTTNPGGVIACKARPTAVIKNCIVKLDFASGTTTTADYYIGGVVGLVSSGAQISDCLVATTDTIVKSVQYGTATLTNCAKYNDVATLLSTATLTNFDTNIWSFDTTNNTIKVKVQA